MNNSKKTFNVDIQCSDILLEQDQQRLDDEKISYYLSFALQNIPHKNEQSMEIAVQLVSCAEIQQLNHQYRNKNKATNILSFPADIPDFVQEVKFLGDLVISVEVLNQEARQLNNWEAHWAHILIHGLLHLFDYDHIEDEDAEIMEALEIELLAKLGFSNPYND